MSAEDPVPSTRCQAGTQHPLMGARLENLLGALCSNRGVRLRDAPLAALCLASATARLPARLLELFWFEVKRAQVEAPVDPVFIVGHWRSGTTHLHNLMSRSPQFGWISPIACGLPDEILTIGTWFRPWLEKALPDDRYVDRVAVHPDSPQEDEIPLANQQGLSLFHALYFPKRFDELMRRGIFFEGSSERKIERWKRAAMRFVEKIAIHQGKRLLLMKNPVYTARIDLLREMWPGARFIHIHRSPYEVYASTLGYNRRMLAELAWQDYSHVDLERFTLQTYLDLMARFDDGRAGLPEGSIAEVRYEDLIANPLPTVARAWNEIGLPGWESTAPLIEDYLSGIGGYQRNRLDYPPEDIAMVQAHWGRYLERWGYEPPA